MAAADAAPPATSRRRAGAHCVDSFSDSSQQLLRGRFPLQPLRGCAVEVGLARQASEAVWEGVEMVVEFIMIRVNMVFGNGKKA